MPELYTPIPDATDSIKGIQTLVKQATLQQFGIVRHATADDIRGGSNAGKVIRPDKLYSALGITAHYVSPAQTVVSGGLVSLSHGMGRKPKLIQASLIYQFDALGYTAGEEVVIATENPTSTSSLSLGVSISSTTSHLYARFGANSTVFYGLSGSNGVRGFAPNSAVKLILRAWA